MQKATVDKNSREYLTRKVATARHTLLLVIIFTVVNLGMILADSGTYFLFSASVPYYLTVFGVAFDSTETAMVIGTFAITALVISAIILALYFVCWLMAKKRPGLWYLVAAVLFALDTLALVGLGLVLNVLTELIMDLVIHAWVLYELFQAYSATKKLAAMPLPVVDTEGEVVEQPAYVPQEPWERKDIE